MKRILLSLFLLVIFKGAFAQLNGYDKVPDDMVVFSLALNHTFMNSPQFNTWTSTNYNLHERYLMNAAIDLGIVNRHYDAGAFLSIPSPYALTSLYFGRKLTARQSKITSWLNLEAGSYSGVFSNIAPVDYTPTADQQGKKLELQYHTAYIALTSKNYLNFLHFSSRFVRKRMPYNAGFYFGVGYMPWNGTWRYGYIDHTFKNVEINNIPKLGKTMVNTGLFFGI